MTDHAKLIARLADECIDWQRRDFDFDKAEAILSAALTADRAAEPTIECPACGASVPQVASATLSLALWQHWNWACPRRAAEAAPPEGLDEPPFDLAHKMQRAALDLAWRAYGHDAEYRERLVNWLREYGLAVYRLIRAPADTRIAERERVAQESEPTP